MNKREAKEKETAKAIQAFPKKTTRKRRTFSDLAPLHTLISSLPSPPPPASRSSSLCSLHSRHHQYQHHPHQIQHHPQQTSDLQIRPSLDPSAGSHAKRLLTRRSGLARTLGWMLCLASKFRGTVSGG